MFLHAALIRRRHITGFVKISSRKCRKSLAFREDDLRQGCVLSSLLLNWMDKLSQKMSVSQLENAKLVGCFFADDQFCWHPLSLVFNKYQRVLHLCWNVIDCRCLEVRTISFDAGISLYDSVDVLVL